MGRNEIIKFDDDITKNEFMSWTNGVWVFNGESKKRAGGKVV